MRSIRALLILGIFLAVLGGIGGAAILIMGYGHDEITKPLWKTGQGWMFQGIINLLIFITLFFLIRKRSKLLR